MPISFPDAVAEFSYGFLLEPPELGELARAHVLLRGAGGVGCSACGDVLLAIASFLLAFS